MSYNNPDIPVIATPTGLDTVIESIRVALSSLTWLEKSFGRGWELKEKGIDNKIKKIPKVFVGTNTSGEGEYLPVLPNDFLKAQSFIAAKGPEEWDQFNRFDGSMKSRRLSIIFWVNLKLIDQTKNFIFIDQLKTDVEKILSHHSSVAKMIAYYDEKVEDVFYGYSIEDVDTQYLMYPYSGMRFDILVNYPEVC